MATKKTSECACENCKCDPCTCKNHESCHTHEGHGGWCGRFWFWAIIRIAIVLGLIIGAYLLGMKMSGYGTFMDRDFDRRWWYSRNMNQFDERMIKQFNTSRQKDSPSPMVAHDPMSMNMADMSKMLEGKTGDDLNKAFLEWMIPHHQAAVDMAKYLAASNKPELVKLGADIIAAQQKEINQMNTWMKEWGYASTWSTSSGTMSMDDAMKEHCKTMSNMMWCEKFR